MKKTLTILFAVAIFIILIVSARSAGAQTITVSQNFVTQWNANLYSPTILYEDQEPGAGQHWSISDGYGIFAFWLDPFGNIQYQSGYPHNPPTLYVNPITTFLNRSSVSLLLSANPFTLTQGVFETSTCSPQQNNPPEHQCLGPEFVFDAVWVCGFTQICIMQLSDPLYTEAHGLRYFIPQFLTNNTIGIATVQTDGTPAMLQAINLPNGDVIIGDTEGVNGSAQATIYRFAPSLQSPCTIGRGENSCGVPFTKIAAFTSNSGALNVQPVYVNSNVYYIIGDNAQQNHGYGGDGLSIYRGNQTTNWVPSQQMITGNVLFPNKFTVNVDSTYLYVGGQAGTNFFIETYYPAQNTTTLLNIDEVAVLGGLSTGDEGEVFLSTHFSGVGADFYYDYVNNGTGTPQIEMGLVYNTDGGHAWSMFNGIALGTDYNILGPPSLAGPPNPPQNYNNGLDYISLIGRGPLNGFSLFIIESIQVTLPSIVSIQTASSSTLWNFAWNTAGTTVTVSSMTGPIVSDMGTPAVMLLVVALPTGVFALGGRLMGGGRAGIVGMILGVAVGLMAGIIYGIYPSWILVLVALGVVAAFLYGRGGGGGGEESDLED